MRCPGTKSVEAVIEPLGEEIPGGDCSTFNRRNCYSSSLTAHRAHHFNPPDVGRARVANRNVSGKTFKPLFLAAHQRLTVLTQSFPRHCVVRCSRLGRVLVERPGVRSITLQLGGARNSRWAYRCGSPSSTPRPGRFRVFLIQKHPLHESRSTKQQRGT